VEHDESRRLGRSSDEQVGDLGAPLRTPLGESILHFHGSVKDMLVVATNGHPARSARRRR